MQAFQFIKVGLGAEQENTAVPEPVPFLDIALGGFPVRFFNKAINEEYIYGKDGRLQNAGFLDYRIPVASDLPMIDTVILEIPNPSHPYGVRGVGETSIVPPLAAIANSVSNAAGVRLTELPMSPPKVLKAIRANGHG